MSYPSSRNLKVNTANKTAQEYNQDYVIYIQDNFPILDVEKMTKDISQRLGKEGITNSLVEIDDYVKKERGEILLNCFPEFEIFVYFSVRYERKNYDRDLYWKITTFIDTNQRHIAQDQGYYVDMPFMTATPSIYLSKIIEKIKAKIIEPLKPIVEQTFHWIQHERDMKEQLRENVYSLQNKFPDLKIEISKDNKTAASFHSMSCALKGLLNYDGSVMFTSLPTNLSKDAAGKVFDAVLNKI